MWMSRTRTQVLWYPHTHRHTHTHTHTNTNTNTDTISLAQRDILSYKGVLASCNLCVYRGVFVLDLFSVRERACLNVEN